MSQTPYHLRQRFGMRADCGPDKKIWRGLLSYTGPNKKELLSLDFAGTMAGALAQFGDPEKNVRRVSQEQLRLKLRLSRRETVTRRFDLFCPADPRWTPERRRNWSDRMKERARKAGKKIHDREMRSIQPVAQMLNRTAGFRGKDPNSYSLRMSPNLKPDFTPQDKRTKTAELLAAVFGSQLFNASARVNGYKRVEAWLWDEMLPLDDYGRVILTYYVLKGIRDEFRKGGRVTKPAGILEISQERVAAELSMDVETVHKYEQQAQDLMILRIVPGEIIYNGDGTVKTKTTRKVLWLTDRLLDHEICVKEMERWQQVRQRIEDQRNHWELARASEIHQQLLKAYDGQEHSLKAFYNELRRRLTAAQLPKDLRDVLIPRPPD